MRGEREPKGCVRHAVPGNAALAASELPHGAEQTDDSRTGCRKPFELIPSTPMPLLHAGDKTMATVLTAVGENLKAA
jgi:hypothetical protein